MVVKEQPVIPLKKLEKGGVTKNKEMSKLNSMKYQLLTKEDMQKLQGGAKRKLLAYYPCQSDPNGKTFSASGYGPTLAERLKGRKKTDIVVWEYDNSQCDSTVLIGTEIDFPEMNKTAGTVFLSALL
jgi:hypothetical protein